MCYVESLKTSIGSAENGCCRKPGLEMVGADCACC